MTLRLAVPADLPKIIEMARKFQEISPYNSLSFSEELCNNLFEQYLMGDKTSLIIIVSEQDGSPRGMIIGLAAPGLFSEDKMATEIAWWMDLEYRGSRDSLLMIDAYQEWAKRVGSRIVQVAMLDEVTDLSKFYLKRGFKQAERSFIKEV